MPPRMGGFIIINFKACSPNFRNNFFSFPISITDIKFDAGVVITIFMQELQKAKLDLNIHHNLVLVIGFVNWVGLK